jgi:uridine kinase
LSNQKQTEHITEEVIAYKVNNQFVQAKSDLPQGKVLEKIYINSPEGQKIYQDFVIFLMNMAVHRLFGADRLVFVEHSIGDGVYCAFWDRSEVRITSTDDVIASLKKEMKTIIKARLPIERITISIDQAYETLKKFRRDDLIRYLDYHNRNYLHFYRCDGYYDYYPRALPFNTGCEVKFDIENLNEGFILRFLNTEKGVKKGKFKLPKLLFSQFKEHESWIKILKVETVGEINRLIEKKRIREFILTEEALHEKKIAHLADIIYLRNDVKFVLVAGPSSSGKTTFAQRLAIQLKVNGFKPFVLGMDDYFLPRAETPILPNGELDFESINAMDLKLLNDDLLALLAGKEVRLPRYNFIKGVREQSDHYLKLGSQNILIMEGIHGLNERLTAAIPQKNKFKIYISALNQLNIDYHNRIPTTDCRKIRRIVRDYQFRGYSAEDTLIRFPSVVAGERVNIFPYQENADIMFNSSLTYELGVLRKHIMPLLRSIDFRSPVYIDAQNLIALFEHFLDIKDELVPSNSLLREFIANSVFEY